MIKLFARRTLLHPLLIALALFAALPSSVLQPTAADASQRVAPRVKESTTTTGTGTVNLAGAASGFQTFVAGFGTGAKVNYTILDGTAWEEGIGTVTSGSPATLSRDVILASSTGAKLTLASGTKTVMASLSARGLLPRGYLSGCAIANNGADANNDIDFGVGECRDEQDVLDIVVKTALTKQLDVSWAAGTNVGGLFTGSKSANTTYHSFLIVKDADGSVDAGFDTSATAANRPAGYTYYRRIGSILTDATPNIRAFVQDGDYFRLKTSILDVNVTNPGTAAVLRALTVPSGIKVFALINGGAKQSTAASRPDTYFSDPDANDQAVSSTAAPLSNSGGTIVSTTGGVEYSFVQLQIRTNTSSQIRTRVAFSDGNSILMVATLGWIDARGSEAKVSFSEAQGILPTGYLSGLTLANNGSDATNDIDLAAGATRSDDDLADLRITSTNVKQLDVTFSEYSAIGTASGGRDSNDNLTGAKTFHVFLIGGPGKNTQGFFSTSLTPTKPSGFTRQRRVGSILWNGSTIVGFIQDGSYFRLKASVLDVNTTNPGTSAVTSTLSVPTGLNVRALINASYGDGAGNADLNISDLAANDEAPSKTAAPLGTLWGGNVGPTLLNTVGLLQVRTNTSAQIRYRAGASSVNAVVRIATIGWIDERGAGGVASYNLALGTLPQGYLAGMGLANNGSDAVNDLDVSPGAARDDADTADMRTTATIVKQLDCTFAEYVSPGTPSCGRDSSDNLTGAKTFHGYAIGGPSKNSQPFFSTSLTPTLPSGFQSKRRISSILWDGATVRGFKQNGNYVRLNSSVLDRNANNPGTSAVTATLTVPTGIAVRAHVIVGMEGATNGAHYVSPLEATDEAATHALGQAGGVNVDGDGSPSEAWVKTNTSGQVRSRLKTSGATVNATISTLGWWDDLSTGAVSQAATAVRAGTPLTKDPYAAGSTTTQAHNLGAEPDSVKVMLECKTAEGNYSVGDRVSLSSSFIGDGGTADRGYEILTDSTNVTLLLGNNLIQLLNKTTWAHFTITAANWKVIATPYKLN